MPPVLVHFDEATLEAIDREAPAAKRQRTEFIRRAVKDALLRREIERQRDTNLPSADVWELPEEW